MQQIRLFIPQQQGYSVRTAPFPGSLHRESTANRACVERVGNVTRQLSGLVQFFLCGQQEVEVCQMPALLSPQDWVLQYSS